MNTITIDGIKCINGNDYDGQWQVALQPTPRLEVGDRIASTDGCDARQWDDLQKACPEGCEMVFDEHNDGYDLYVVEPV